MSFSLNGDSTTRWSAKKKAVCNLHTQIGNVIVVLKDIVSDRSMNSETVDGAKVILKLIDFKFLALLDFWSQIMTFIDRENMTLQTKALSIDTAAEKCQRTYFIHSILQGTRH